jgi:hypothetical protein
MTIRNYSLNYEEITLERLNGEVLIISFSKGKFYSSKGTGADILTLLNERVSTDYVIEVLKSIYPNFSYKISGFEEFIENLFKLEIIRENNEVITKFVKMPNDTSRASWAKPELLTHDEIHGLLLVDPIHDSTEEGWPKPKND